MKTTKNMILLIFTLVSLTLYPVLHSCSTKEIVSPITVHSIQPSEDNPRNSEGDFINLKAGRVMFVYSRYTGTSSSDHAPAHLAARFSEDGGKSWTEEIGRASCRERG